jgi:hypothetical protein
METIIAPFTFVKRTSNMRNISILAIVFLTTLSPRLNAQTGDDSLAIRQAALNYIEGWYEGSAERMERALHPELAKRMVSTDANSNRSRLSQMSAMTLVQSTRAGGGKKTPVDQQLKDVAILDIYNNAASVKIVASGWIDYLHMAKWNGEWKIVNVLWELKPEKK